ncbi:uracil-DNA glycosylase [Ilumatobacter sp.]|uniref:uracil-DNA glycosylase n=1 Tax=Ilumatobacter sp. TaxID=1967498 RepID=UPI003B528B10
MATTDWNPLLRAEFERDYWAELQSFVADERSRHTVYPPHDEVFTALHLTPFAELKVVILGQDPYHGARQANGLAFSVRPGVRIPPSLRNIHAELRDDLGLAVPDHGDLGTWARRGVLLLNTSLTVRAGQAGSHSGKGWETFTDRVIDVVSERADPVVFVLWGNHARRKRERIDTARHAVIESPHPSPFSASSGFFGSKPFSRANEALIALGRDPVDWDLGDTDLADTGADPGGGARGDGSATH